MRRAARAVSRSWRGRLAGALALGFALAAGAAEELPVTEWLVKATETLKAREAALGTLEGGKTDQKVLAEILKEMAALRSRAQRCIDNQEAAQAKATRDLATLGEPTPGEDQQVTVIREELKREQKAKEKLVASCKLVLLQSQDFANLASEREQRILAERLLARGPHLWTVVGQNLDDPLSWWNTARDFVVQRSGLRSLNLIDFVLVGLFAVAAALFARSAAVRLRPRETTAAVDLAAGFVRSVRACTARALPVLLPLAAVALYLSLALPLDPLPFVTEAVYGIALYIVLSMAVRALLAPCAPAQPYLPLSAELSKTLGRRGTVLLALGLVGYLLFATVLGEALPEPQYNLARAVYVAFLVINLLWIVWLAGHLRGLLGGYALRTPLVLALLATLAAEWGGYHNFATLLLRGLLGTALGLVIAWLLARVSRDLFDGLDEGRQPWERGLRERIGLREGQRMPGIVWVRLLVTLLIWGGVALWTLRVWGLSDKGMLLILTGLTDGFTVGSVHVVPTRLLGAVLLFVVLVSVVGWIKSQLVPQWLERTSLERGAREAMVTMSGYVGIIVALLVALSMAGFDFTSLAIIAGALSLGIGFGLQNIVNNFVSGLILLFERPLRTGDWIVVGSTEGYVRKISIRSTQIETFDRADVIVPNSELIANQVTNWMLQDPYGRVIVPVGVAYGSDTARVKEILLKVADAHPLVLRNHPKISPPTVIFRAFGASSLDFELRCFISQVDRRLAVLSDLNFAIDAAFRDAGIEIPFPQRDVHVRTLPPGQAGSAGPKS